MATDLHSINGNWIAQDDPVGASAFLASCAIAAFRSDFPKRGTPRDDIRPGVRTLAFRRRPTIAYSVEPGEVTILGVFYAGQDVEGVMREE